MAEKLKTRTKIHYIDTPIDIIRLRLESRNNVLPAYNFRIIPDRIKDFASTFEIPSPDEGMEIILVS